MKTSNKILLAGLILILAAVTVFLSTFRIRFQEDAIMGSGNIITSERDIPSFTGIQVDGNFSVTLKHAEFQGIELTADDNIMDYIITEVKDGVLHIYSRERFGKISKPTAIVSFDQLETIVSRAGASLSSVDYIEARELTLELMGGSKLSLNCRVDELNLTMMAGSEATLKGKATKVIAESLAGSYLHAEELMAEIVFIDTHAGAQNKVYASEEIKIMATTGSSVDYYGNPGLRNINANTGGSARSK